MNTMNEVLPLRTVPQPGAAIRHRTPQKPLWWETVRTRTPDEQKAFAVRYPQVIWGALIAESLA
jgi:hypothetical protein